MLKSGNETLYQKPIWGVAQNFQFFFPGIR
jgi:hypothetical protein